MVTRPRLVNLTRDEAAALAPGDVLEAYVPFDGSAAMVRGPVTCVVLGHSGDLDELVAMTRVGEAFVPVKSPVENPIVVRRVYTAPARIQLPRIVTLPYTASVYIHALAYPTLPEAEWAAVLAEGGNAA